LLAEFELACAVALGEVLGIFGDFVIGEPAGCGKVGGAGGFGLAHFLALLLVKVFGEGPLGFEDAGGAAILMLGGEGFGVFAFGGFGDLAGDGLFVFGEPALADEVEADEAGGDGAAIADGAGRVVVEVAIEEALHGLGEGELDGGGVFEEGDAVVAFDSGEGGAAVVFVGVTVVVAGHGLGTTLLAAGFDVAALALLAHGVGGLGFGSGGWFSFRHGVSLLRRAQSAERGAQKIGWGAKVVKKGGACHPRQAPQMPSKGKAPPGEQTTQFENW